MLVEVEQKVTAEDAVNVGTKSFVVMAIQSLFEAYYDVGGLWAVANESCWVDFGTQVFFGVRKELISQ